MEVTEGTIPFAVVTGWDRPLCHGVVDVMQDQGSRQSCCPDHFGIKRVAFSMNRLKRSAEIPHNPDSLWSLRPGKTIRSAAHIQMARYRQCLQIHHRNVIRCSTAHERA